MGLENRLRVSFYMIFFDKPSGGGVKLISFPNYESESSLFVKRYLNGEFPKTAQDGMTYRRQTSSFYALDRSITLHNSTDGGKTLFQQYLEGAILLMDRYTTSNILHQTFDMNDEEFDEYVNWLCSLEYEALGVIRPDYVFFLNTPLSVSVERLSNRPKDANKNKMENDIHENEEHLQKVSSGINRIIRSCGWIPIDTYSIDNKPLSPESVSEKIQNYLRNIENL